MSVVGGHAAVADLLAGNESLIDNSTSVGTLPHFCKLALTEQIGGNPSIRIWDTAILLPNVIFFFFLLYKLPRVRHKLSVTRSPVFKAFFILVYVTTVINVSRCVVSMCITATNEVGGIADKILWLILKFFLLSAEMCVLTFGLLFGHLDSRTSIRRVLLATVLVSLVFSSAQSLLEFRYPDTHYADPQEELGGQLDLFAHGGMLFWSISSTLFVVLYVSACLLPFTRLRYRFTIPTKPSFYIYCIILAILNAIQVVGALLIYKNVLSGMCVVDLTSYSYFALYTPLVYAMFLRVFVSDPQPGALFSYAQHKDELQPGEMDARYQRGFTGLTSSLDDDSFNTAEQASTSGGGHFSLGGRGGGDGAFFDAHLNGTIEDQEPFVYDHHFQSPTNNPFTVDGGRPVDHGEKADGQLAFAGVLAAERSELA